MIPFFVTSTWAAEWLKNEVVLSEKTMAVDVKLTDAKAISCRRTPMHSAYMMPEYYGDRTDVLLKLKFLKFKKYKYLNPLNGKSAFRTKGVHYGIVEKDKIFGPKNAYWDRPSSQDSETCRVIEKLKNQAKANPKGRVPATLKIRTSFHTSVNPYTKECSKFIAENISVDLKNGMILKSVERRQIASGELASECEI